FNEATDTVIFNPVGEVYDAITPRVVDDGVSNFFSNLGDIAVAANDFLQLDFHQGMTTVTRFVLNSTLGIGGIFDFSGTYAGSPKTENDFGLTLAHYGVESGPYLVLPLFGPSSVRDTSRFVDGFMNPLFYLGNHDTLKYSLMALNFVDIKSDLASTRGLVQEAALDEYDFVKSAYLERRRAQIEGGTNPDMQDMDAY
ncbi:MAG: VacJ family lipoprotein, partial [Gammaproteobacteria bacterium]